MEKKISCKIIMKFYVLHFFLCDVEDIKCQLLRLTNFFSDFSKRISEVFQLKTTSSIWTCPKSIKALISFIGIASSLSNHVVVRLIEFHLIHVTKTVVRCSHSHQKSTFIDFSQSSEIYSKNKMEMRKHMTHFGVELCVMNASAVKLSSHVYFWIFGDMNLKLRLSRMRKSHNNPTVF